MQETVELVTCPSPVSSQPPKAANLRVQMSWDPSSHLRGQAPAWMSLPTSLWAQEVSLSLTFTIEDPGGMWAPKLVA